MDQQNEARPRNNISAILLPLLLVGLAGLALYVCRAQLIRRSAQVLSDALQSAVLEKSATLSAVAGGQLDLLFAAAVDAAPFCSPLRTVERLSSIPCASACRAIGFANARGILTLSDGRLLSVADEAFHTAALSGGSSMEFRTSAFLPDAPVILSVPVLENGGAVGALCAFYDAALLTDILTDRNPGSDALYGLTGDGGRILSIGTPDSAQRSAFADALSVADASAGTGFSDQTGCVASVESAIPGVSIVGVLPTAAIAASITASMDVLYALASILLTGAILVLVYHTLTGRDRLSKVAASCAQLSYKASTDALTGLLNRSALEQEVGRFLAASADAACHALLIVDLDNFKSVNDTFGHMDGDRLLTLMAQKLKARFRSGDILGRLGGDEFVILLKNVGGAEQAARMAEELCGALDEEYRVGEQSVHVSGSIGIAMRCGGQAGFPELYREADSALYEAKRLGKNRFAFFAPPTGEPAPS